MAIFHAQIQKISRSEGRSAVAAAAYRAGAELWDERAGKTHDYTGKAGVVGSFIALPATAPAWMRDRSMLWNMAEWTEKRVNSVVARELEVSLPHDLPGAAREKVAMVIGQFLVDRYGVAADICLHLPSGTGDERNHHAHILFSTRAVTETGFGAKTRVLDDRKTGPEEITAIRQGIAEIINAALAAHGICDKVDHRSHRDRGIAAPAQIHVGVSASNMERGGRKPKKAYREKDTGTRAQHNADIIDLQSYRKEETDTEKLARLKATLADTGASIEELQATLNSEYLSDDLRAQIRFRLEKAYAVIFLKQQETTYMREVRENRAKAARIADLQEYQERLNQMIAELEHKRKEEEGRREAARQLNAQVLLMSATLNGIPPYRIELQIPLAAQFNEVSYRQNLKAMTTANIERSLFEIPIKALPLNMAPASLRKDVLSVKELLARAKPTAQGRGQATASTSFKRSMRR